MATIIQQLAAQVGIPPEVFALFIGVAGIALSIAHSRGNTLPVLSTIFALLGAKQAPVVPAGPTVPATPADPSAAPHLGDGHIIKSILADIALLKLALPAQPAPVVPAVPAAGS